MRKPTPVVHPDWVVQSIAQRSLLPIAPFLCRGFADSTQNTLLGSNNILNLSSSSSFSLASPVARRPAASETASPVSESVCAEESSGLRFVFADQYLSMDDNAAVAASSRDESPEVIVIDDEDEDEEKEDVQVIHVREDPIASHPQIQAPTGPAAAQAPAAEQGTMPSPARVSPALQSPPPFRIATPAPPAPPEPLPEAIDNSGGTAHDISIVQVPQTDGRSDVQWDSRRKPTRDGAEFVRHFFAKSRLHHIGNWRSTFQQKAGEFLSIYKGPSIQREASTSSRRVILHVDMDCFFVAVAVRERPELKNVPVAVAHSGNAGTSEISSCNYLAREKGVRAGMFMQAARELCPELVVLPYKFDEIEQVSFQIYNIFFSHTPYVQAMSCDEALLEFGEGTDGMERAQQIREEIFASTRCPASVGVSYNILLAKLASKQAKPDGMYQIESPERAEPFLLSLSIHDLPGVGRRMSSKLQDIGLDDMLQMRALSKSELARHFGKTTSEMLFNFARGIDHRALSIESNMSRKSVSAVVNFGIRFESWDDAAVFMAALAEELQSRLQNLKVRTECLTLLIKKRRDGEPIKTFKYMGHGVCDNFSKSQVLAAPTNDAQTISKVCIELLRQFRFPPSDLRGVGIQATKLVGESAAGAATTSRKTRQLFESWISESARGKQGEGGASSVEKQVDVAGHNGSRVQDDQLRVSSRRETTPGLSQVNMSVLEELPSWIRDEVLSTYRPHSTHASAQPPPLRLNALPPPQARGKKPLQRSRTAHSSSKPSVPRAHNDDTSAATANALDDIRMSQIDSDVYYALPFTLRKEIDRHAKKSSAASSVAAVSRAKALAAASVAPVQLGGATEAASKPLQSIEQLFQSLLEATSVTARAQEIESGGRDDQQPPSQDAAFDSIYLRIMMEVENHALDHALRMLRYVRRKCQSAAGSQQEGGESALKLVLHAGFNRVLEQVNRDVRHHFRGVLSLRAVAPL